MTGAEVEYHRGSGLTPFRPCRAARAADLTRDTGVVPCLATVLVGDDPASVTYVRMKRARCERAGITSFEAIAPDKDVDGVTTRSFAAVGFGLPGFVSCTPGGIMRLLDAYDVDLTGKHAVVVGRSAILGRPVGMLLLARDATVTYCHSRTSDLASIARQADVLVAAVGRPRFIREVKEGAVVIDAGSNPGNVGDVDFDAVRNRASLITPVPGGVGPMTIAVLLEQTVEAAARRTGHAG